MAGQALSLEERLNRAADELEKKQSGQKPSDKPPTTPPPPPPPAPPRPQGLEDRVARVASDVEWQKLPWQQKAQYRWRQAKQLGTEALQGARAGAMHSLENIAGGATRYGLQAIGQPELGRGLEWMVKESPRAKQLATPPATTTGKLAYGGEQMGEFLLPIPGVGKIRAAQNAPMLLRGGSALVREGVDVFLKTLAQTGSLEEAKRSAEFAGPTGAIAEIALPGIGRMLNQCAQSQYAKVMHPLGRQAKELAEEQIPRIVGEGYRAATAFTKKGLLSKFNERVADLGPKLAQEYAKLDQTTRTLLGPIYQDFADWMGKEVFTKYGGVKDVKLGNTALEIWSEIQQAFGRYAKSAHPSEVWEIRQALDKYVYRNRLTADESVAAANQVKKGFGNVIRNQLNSQHPSVAALNDQFHLWKSAATLMYRNVTNEFGQLRFARNSGIIGRFLMGAALGGGADVASRRGHPTWETGAAAALAGLAFESTSWRTVSAVTKAKIAEFLVGGYGVSAANLAARAVGIATQVPHPPQTSAAAPGGRPLYMAPGPTEGLLQSGTIDLTQLPSVPLGNDTWGTVHSESREVPGVGEVLYPTIVNGRQVSSDEAFESAMKTGRHLGIFHDGATADRYAQRLHEDWQAGRIPGVQMQPGTPPQPPLAPLPPELVYQPQPGRIQPAPAPGRAPTAAAPSGGAELPGLLANASREHGVPLYVMRHVAGKETSGTLAQRAVAVSPKGAVGVMQITPDTAKTYGGDPDKLTDPAYNVWLSGKILRKLADDYHGDWELALAAYNSGPGNVQKYGGVPPFRETRNYLLGLRR